MYNAYGLQASTKQGTTNLHLDISDAVNIMVWAECGLLVLGKGALVLQMLAHVALAPGTPSRAAFFSS
jgi:hypothetical protein